MLDNVRKSLKGQVNNHGQSQIEVGTLREIKNSPASNIELSAEMYTTKQSFSLMSLLAESEDDSDDQDAKTVE